MKKSVSNRIAFVGVMFALLFVVLTIETYVFIYFIKPSPAFLTIPLAIALSIFDDKKTMLIGGTLLGVASFILSFIVGLVPFYNPLISVLPRMLMGVVCYYVFKGAQFLLKNKKNEYAKNILPSALTGMAGVLFNTITVISLLYTFGFGEGSLGTALSILIGLNFSLEFVSAIILVPVFVKTLKKLNAKFEREKGL